MTETLAETKNVVKADEVIGVKVINAAGDNLGKIYQIVLDKLTGQTVYVVLESGSILGLGGKLFALPWKVFHYDTNEEAFVVNIDKEKLKTAPGFDKNNWPDMAESSFAQTISSFYGKDIYK